MFKLPEIFFINIDLARTLELSFHHFQFYLLIPQSFTLETSTL